MGDRANVVIKEEGTPNLYLYTHWEGTALPRILKAALIRGKDKWNDSAYLARIIFSEMVKDDIEGILGYGISTEICDGGEKLLEVDVPNQIIEMIYYGSRHLYTFETFISLNATWPILHEEEI